MICQPCPQAETGLAQPALLPRGDCQQVHPRAVQLQLQLQHGLGGGHDAAGNLGGEYFISRD